MFATRPDGRAPPSWWDTLLTGRVVAALAADPAILDRSGQALRARDLAAELGIEDVPAAG